MKANISAAMHAEARRALGPRGVLVTGFQLARVSVAPELQAALLTSAIVRLRIQSAERYKEVMRVALAIRELAARYRLIEAVALARGAAAARRETALANAQITAQTVAAEMGVLAQVQERAGLTTADGLLYKYWDFFDHWQEARPDRPGRGWLVTAAAS
jgi:hypothetical protein